MCHRAKSAHGSSSETRSFALHSEPGSLCSPALSSAAACPCAELAVGVRCRCRSHVNRDPRDPPFTGHLEFFRQLEIATSDMTSAGASEEGGRPPACLTSPSLSRADMKERTARFEKRRAVPFGAKAKGPSSPPVKGGCACRSDPNAPVHVDPQPKGGLCEPCFHAAPICGPSGGL